MVSTGVPIRLNLCVARSCLVCAMFPWERAQIDELLREGKSLRFLAGISDISRSSLSRHRKRHLREIRAGNPKEAGPVIYNPRVLWERGMAVRQAERNLALSRLERELGQSQLARLLGGGLSSRQED